MDGILWLSDQQAELNLPNQEKKMVTKNPLNVARYEGNPIITVDDVKPSREGWNVEYTMNAGKGSG